ncbi:unnamed protein product, partial [Prorocentrum cordatum]
MSSGSAAASLPGTFGLDEYGLAESDTAAGPNKMTCFVCEEEELCTKEWRGAMLGQRCWNAVRAHRLQLKGNAKALKESADLVKSDPDQFRAQVKPYIPTDTTSRRIARDETQKQLVVQQTTDRSVESKREGKKTEFYSKRHFKSYRAFWDKVESDDASEEFDAMQDADPHFDSDGEAVQPLKARKYTREESGRDTSTGKVTQRVLEDEGGHNEPARSPSANLRQLMGLGDLPSGHLEKIPRGGSPLRSLAAKRDRMDDDSASVKTKAPRKDIKSKIEEGNEEALFLVAKEEISESCVNLLQRHTGAKSMAHKLEALVKKHSQNSDAPNCTQILADYATHVHEVMDIKGPALKDLKADGVDGLKDRLAAVTQALNDFEEQAKKKTTTFCVMDSTARKAQRTEYLAVRHQKGKVANALTAGGYHTKHAKVIGSLVCESSGTPLTAEETGVLFKIVNVNPAELIPSEVCAWAMTESKGLKVRSAIMDKCGLALDEKVKVLDKQMETTKWTGALTRLTSDLTTVDFQLPESSGELFMEGNHPSIVTLRRDACRRGPAAFNMSGAGCYVMALSEPIIFMVYKIEELLARGI